MDHIDRIIAQWNRERPELDTGPMAVIGRVARLAALLRREMHQTWSQYGLNAASFDVLATLRRAAPEDGLSPGELLEETMVTSGTMTNRIDQLEKAGLVARIRNPEDGRGYLIRLTEKGFALIEAAVTDHVATQQRLLSGLGTEDRDRLDRLLADWTDSLSESGSSRD
jgi:DNA-binding MarR family transcriptional regulator